MLLGVSEESKAYSHFYPVSKKIMIRSDVVFPERWNWKKESEGNSCELLDLGDKGHEDIEHEEKGDDVIVQTEAENADHLADSSNNLASDSASGETSAVPTQGRSRRRPAWLDDYVISE